jgi:hypothetical protein
VWEGIEVEGLELQYAYFRGRKLQGTVIPIPQGYSVLDSQARAELELEPDPTVNEPDPNQSDVYSTILEKSTIWKFFFWGGGGFTNFCST